MKILFEYVLPVAIFIFGMWLAVKTDLLKDTQVDNGSEKTYSFSRSQLFYWTMIVIICLCAGMGNNGNFDLLLKLKEPSILLLLGISVGTASVATYIDNEIPNPKKNTDSNGFIRDILSDAGGISVHRYQALLFNIIFGLVFVCQFINNTTEFPVFGNYALALMGTSSAGYLLIKTNEKQKKTVSDSSVINVNTNTPVK
ncbi:hypothetical protein [Chryseobacterium nepalense]|uniref:Uncharacterized protein n=1 Tax=Chryseobacterium nepalense TaxID=1854498 RepID=A0ABY4K5Z2_9FLAO|nr:hypothetical protein [Chryseobacterium nepalense]UPQ75022.1 hypothetical protein M0D58_13310 [Chryseobacterium nepalense]